MCVYKVIGGNEELEFVFDKFCTYWIKILLDYFNAKLGREDASYYHSAEVKVGGICDVQWGRWNAYIIVIGKRKQREVAYT